MIIKYSKDDRCDRDNRDNRDDKNLYKSKNIIYTKCKAIYYLNN